MLIPTFSGDTLQPTVFKAKGSPVDSGTATPEVSSGIVSRRMLHEPSEMVKDGINALASGSDLQNEEVEKMSSVLPTMWLGAQSGRYVIFHCLYNYFFIENTFTVLYSVDIVIKLTICVQ